MPFSFTELWESCAYGRRPRCVHSGSFPSIMRRCSARSEDARTARACIAVGCLAASEETFRKVGSCVELSSLTNQVFPYSMGPHFKSKKWDNLSEGKASLSHPSAPISVAIEGQFSFRTCRVFPDIGTPLERELLPFQKGGGNWPLCFFSPALPEMAKYAFGLMGEFASILRRSMRGSAAFRQFILSKGRRPTHTGTFVTSALLSSHGYSCLVPLSLAA
jgi:hypothetical protein